MFREAFFDETIEIKVGTGRGKFDVTTRDRNSTGTVRERPGVTKSLGEERVCDSKFALQGWRLTPFFHNYSVVRLF